jgi:hypothetical protein
MHKAYWVAVAGLFFVVSACSDTVSPADLALDGPWTSGHQISGLEMGLNLTWSRDRVSGTGSINAAPPSAHCGSIVIDTLTTVTLAASRLSSTEIRGTMTIGGDISVTYQGSLNSSANYIDASLIARDGTGCAISLSQGLIP